ncbi:hypothetical protein D3C80_2123640 [compost metagenome]
MKTAEIFRKHNFLLLDSIMNNGDYSIEAKMFTDPFDSVFNKPYSNIKPHKNPKINGNKSNAIKAIN